jgi:hypothetical protein
MPQIMDIEVTECHNELFEDFVMADDKEEFMSIEEGLSDIAEQLDACMTMLTNIEEQFIITLNRPQAAEADRTAIWMTCVIQEKVALSELSQLLAVLEPYWNEAHGNWFDFVKWVMFGSGGPKN